MSTEVLRVLQPGLGASLQDQGRRGAARFGVPIGGAMDPHAAQWANALLDNPRQAPVIEWLLQGAKLEVLDDVWVAIAGADAEATIPVWRAVQVKRGRVIEFPRHRAGVWYYLGVEGGFVAEQFFGSASAYPRGRLGDVLEAGTVLRRNEPGHFQLPQGIAGRTAHWTERRDYRSPPPLRVWPAPQWEDFGEKGRRLFFDQVWTVTAQSDRVGYRLSGRPLPTGPHQLISEPMCPGTVQVPPNGQPIVTMRDGPTVGGYPKLGMVEPAELSWLAQCAPGQTVRFIPAVLPGGS